MKKLLVCWMLIQNLSALAQVSEDFSDGDFTTNPEWIGDITEFEIEAEQLNSNGPASTSVLHLSTANTLIDNTTWEFLIDLRFPPSGQSGSNKVRAYLVSDQSDLESDLLGYFIEIGQSGDDEIKLYRQDGVSATLLFTGTSQLTGNVTVRLQISRDGGGNWNVNADTSGASNFLSEGESFQDNTYTTTAYFGFVGFHSSTRADLFYFDDISIAAEEPPFSVVAVNPNSSNSLLVTYSQNVEGTSATDVENYSVDFDYGSPVSATIESTEAVLLTFADDFVNNGYSVTISNIQNQSQDEVIVDYSQLIEISTATSFREIVINEIYADFNPSAVGLPDEEYLELFNTSSQAIQIEQFTINENALEPFVLLPNAYVILTDDSNVSSFEAFGDVVSVPSFPALTNGGMQLLFHDQLGNLIDSLTYDLSWYHDEAKDDGGFSIEQINPGHACKYSQNWIASSHANGGTPGTENAVFDESPDVASPSLISMIAINENKLQLTFDEPMLASSLEDATYTFTPELTINTITVQRPQNLSVLIETTENLTSGTVYELAVSDATDCSGNLIDANTATLFYDDQPPTLTRIVVVSDTDIRLHFDENISVESAKTEDNFSLDQTIGIPLSSEILSDDPSRVELVFETSFTLGLSYSLSIFNLSDTLGNNLLTPLTSAFIYEQYIDTILVISANHLQVYFSENVASASATLVDNFWIDSDVGHPVSASLDSDNSRIVHLIFQTDLPDNKSLTLSTTDIKNESGDFLTTPEKQFVFDTSPPKIDSILIPSASTMEIYFSEKVNSTEAEAPENYENEDIYPALAQLSDNQKVVTLTFENDFGEEIAYVLSVEAIQDLYGNTLSSKLKESFAFDLVPPRVDSIYIKSPAELVLVFHEPLDVQTAEAVDHYVLAGFGNPILAQLNQETMRHVTIQFGEVIPELANLSLTISDVSDQRGNQITAPIEVTFDNDQLNIGSIFPLDAYRLQIELTQSVESDEAERLSNYLMNGETQPVSVDFEDRKGVLIFENPFQVQTEYQLLVPSIGTMELAIDSYPFSYSPMFEFGTMVNEYTIELSFLQALLPDQIIEKQQFQIEGDTELSSVLISSENSKVIRLIFEQPLAADVNYLVSWHGLKNEFGNAISGFSTAIHWDQTPPETVALLVLDQNRLKVRFNEALYEKSAEFVLNYGVDHEIGQATEASYTQSDSTVTLSFNSPFLEGIDYQLIVENVKDNSGNPAVSQTMAFEYFKPYSPVFGDLIISEIMAEPDDNQPEFLEFYNASQEEIEMAGLILADGTSTATFTSGTIDPASYLVIASSQSSLESVNNVTLSKWLTLNNGGENLSIYNGEELIFSTTYNEEWYQNDDKKQGGFSLEMIDLTNPCGEQQNWTGSIELGGTPGLINSVKASNPDESAPNVLKATFLSENSVLLSLDEKVMAENDLIPKIDFDSDLTISSALQNHPEYNQIQIGVAESFISNTIYEITIEGLEDCVGNVMAKNVISILYDDLAPELERIEVISDSEVQLYFDESLDELSAKKGSHYTVNHEIGSPKSAMIVSDEPAQVLLQFAGKFERDLENTLTITHLADTLGNAITAPVTFPFAYTSGVDTIFVKSASHIQLLFAEAVEVLSATNYTNYQVDREVGFPVSAYFEVENPLKLNLIFQHEFPENKLMSLSIRHVKKENGDYLPTPKTFFLYDTAPPKIDTLSVLSARTIELKFAENVARNSAESPENYEYEDTYPLSAQLSADQRTVSLNFKDEFLSEVNFNLWISQIKDLYGNEMTTRLKVPFVYDIVPPRIDSVYVLSPNSLRLVFSEKVSVSTAENLNNHEIVGFSQPNMVKLDMENSRHLTLTFADDLPESDHLELVVQDINDLNGNSIDASQESFRNDRMTVGTLVALSQNSVQIEFTKSVDKAEAEIVSHYLLNESLQPISASFDDRIGLLTFDEVFQEENYLLTVKPIGNMVDEISIAFSFNSQFEKAVITNEKTIELTFHQKLLVDQNIETSAFSLHEFGSPIEALISTELSSTIRLIFENPLLPNTTYQLAWPRLQNEYGNWLPANSTRLVWDQSAPEIAALTVLDQNSIWVQFSENLIENSAAFHGNYSVEPVIGAVSEVTYNKSDSSAILHFNNPFQDGITYHLNVNNLKDLSGNASVNLTETFQYITPYSPVFGDLIITEIMAEPNEDQNEFLEIYNPTDQTIHLSGLTLRDATSEATFTNGSLASNAYFVISTSQTSLSKWLTLNNGGETLSIYNEDELIFSTSYDEDWYHSEEKKAGGYSLEMVDVNNPCGERKNWTGSISLGGTPGLPNTVATSNPDQNSPVLVKSVLESETAILLEFDEKLKPTTDLLSKITLSPNLVIDSVYQNEPQNTQIHVALIESVVSKETYELLISDVSDCVGNWIKKPDNQATLILPEAAEAGDIIINEILFNPRSGGVDFVELYNYSDKVIDLKGWYLADKSTDLKTITNEPFLLHPATYFVATSDPDILAADYPNGHSEAYFKTNSFPSLNDDEDSVLLFDDLRQVIDSVYYDRDFHFGLLNDDEGVSLERIAFEAPAYLPDSWQSAASTVGYATPGLVNSQSISVNKPQGAVAISPKVFFPDNTGQDDFTTISYDLSHTGSFANILVFNSTGTIIKTIAQNELLSTRGFVTWDGTSNAGTLAHVGYYIVHFEIYDASGSKNVYKETVALGTRF